MFTDAEFAERYLKALKKVSNRRRKFEWEHRASETTGSGVRMSGVGDCARKQYYKAKKSPITNRSNDDGTYAWPQMMGFAGQALVAEVLREMGYKIFDEEKTVEYQGIIGHIDGKITGLDLEDEVLIWDCKVKGAFPLYANEYGIITRGLPAADVSIYLQQNFYAAAEELDRSFLTAVPHDLGAARLEAIKRKIEQPSYVVNRIVIERDIRAVEIAVKRAHQIETFLKANIIPQPEFDAKRTKFPCGLCEWKERCLSDGNMGVKVAEIPEDWVR